MSGHDPELARVIVQQLGVPRVEWQLVEFSSLIAGLNANQYDVIAAGMFITPEREQQVAFSMPTFRVDAALLVQRGNPHQLHSYADIARDPTARIAVLSGSFEEKQLGRAGVPAERLVAVPDARSGRILVDSAQVDGLALSAPTIHWMVEQKKVRESEMASPFESFPAPAESPTKLGAFAFRLEDVALRRAWNAELKQFLGTEAHLRLMNQFGFTAADMPPSATNTNPSQKP